MLPMSETVLKDAKIASVSSSDSQSTNALKPHKQETESATCNCCGLTEECTPGYIARVRERYLGNWICGLCSEAVKYELRRNGRLISTEEAVTLHMNVCATFRAGRAPLPDPTADIMSVVKHILRRSPMHLPLTIRSTPGSPVNGGGRAVGRVLGRSESCFPSFTGV